jgi:hypothetical protein
MNTPMSRTETIERALASYRRVEAIDGYTYLIGSVAGHGIFLAPPPADFTEEMYEACIDESDAAGLDSERLYVHARRSLIGAGDMVLNQAVTA